MTEQEQKLLREIGEIQREEALRKVTESVREALNEIVQPRVEEGSYDPGRIYNDGEGAPDLLNGDEDRETLLGIRDDSHDSVE